MIITTIPYSHARAIFLAVMFVAMAGFFAVNYPTSDSLTGQFTFNALKPGGSYAIPRAYLDDPLWATKSKQAISSINLNPTMLPTQNAPTPYIATDLVPEGKKRDTDAVGIDISSSQASPAINPFSRLFSINPTPAIQDDGFSCDAQLQALNNELARKDMQIAEMQRMLAYSYFGEKREKCCPKPGETESMKGLCAQYSSKGQVQCEATGLCAWSDSPAC
ncbi:MAG TPA: hypothetical protein VJC07_01555 [Candidatus Nanoarchaeia archaeon]|nr:hypothetical protein [Candidatus Nanoarchaeia archaeon]